MKSFAALFSAVAAVVPFVAADFIPAGTAAHFFSSQNTSLVFAPEFAAAGANLVAALAGDGSSADITALFPVKGTGVPTQIAYGDFCITANGVVPSTANQTLYIADCDPADATQLWTVNESPATVSNADGNCYFGQGCARCGGVAGGVQRCAPASPDLGPKARLGLK